MLQGKEVLYRIAQAALNNTAKRPGAQLWCAPSRNRKESGRSIEARR